MVRIYLGWYSSQGLIDLQRDKVLTVGWQALIKDIFTSRGPPTGSSEVTFWLLPSSASSSPVKALPFPNEEGDKADPAQRSPHWLIMQRKFRSETKQSQTPKGSRRKKSTGILDGKMQGPVSRSCVLYGSYTKTVKSQVDPTGPRPLLRSLHCSGSFLSYLLSSLDGKSLEKQGP